MKTFCHGDTLEPSKRTCTASAAVEVVLLYSIAEHTAVVHGDDNKLSKPIAIPYTAASNSCTLYSFLLRAYNAEVCCNNYCWGHRLGLLTLARVLCPVAASFASVGCRRMRARMHANKKKGESYKTRATPLWTTIRRMPEKMREQFCESGSTFGPRFGTQFWLQFWPPFFQFVL